jgi:uncharacterized protein
MQGSHPEGTDVSALTHILGQHATIPADSGLFLEETWRLHPKICALTSELFYEGRLRSRPGLELQEIRSKSRISGSGLRFLPVVHEGNQSSCLEEADAIRDLVAEILNSQATWMDRESNERRLNSAIFLSLRRITRRFSSCRTAYLAAGSARSINFKDRKPRLSSIQSRPPVI